MMTQGLLTLEHRLHREVPLTRHMGIRLERYGDGELLVRADLASNVNIHGTAFGGSLFSICAVACWGLLHLNFEQAGLDAHTVLGEASINYYQPVRADLVVSSRMPDDGSFEIFLDSLERGGRASIRLVAMVQYQGRPAVKFQGEYSAHRPAA